MPITVETTGLDEVQAYINDLGGLLTQSASSEVLAESEALQENVAAQMPVDTGWAQARWGDPSVPGGIWNVSDDGLSIEQGSDLQSELGLYEYVTRLNEGSSKQAPAGFIDNAAEQSGDRLEARLNEITDIVE